MSNNEIDIITYFDTKFNALREYFDERFKNMDSRISCIEVEQEDELNHIAAKLTEHDKRIQSLENTEGNKARDFLNSIKENTMKYAVPSIIILFVYLLGTGELVRILGIN